MSTALVIQALEFVDPDESGKEKKRGASRGDRRQGSSGQGRKPRKQKVKQILAKRNSVEQNKIDLAVKQLLALSSPAVHSDIAGKIVERAVQGKALADKIEVNNQPQKSILFSDDEEDFDKFEEELFCS